MCFFHSPRNNAMRLLIPLLFLASPRLFWWKQTKYAGRMEGLDKAYPCICNEACVFQTGKQGYIQYVSPFSNIGICYGIEKNVQWLQKGLGVSCYLLGKRRLCFCSVDLFVCLSVCLFVSYITPNVLTEARCH